MTNTKFADRSAVGLEYDVHGNVVGATDPNGNVLSVVYDKLNRPVSRTIAPGAGVGGGTIRESFTYDCVGHLISATNADYSVTFTYDDAGRVVSESVNGQTTGYARDTAGNVTTLSYPSGRSVTRSFDNLNRLHSVSSGGQAVASYEYAGPGRISWRLGGDGVREDYTWDAAARVTATQHVRSADGAVLDSRTYAWDADGNKTSRSDVRARQGDLPEGLRYTFANDSLGRLCQSTSGSTDLLASYGLDAAGNRQSVTGLLESGLYGLSGKGAGLNQYAVAPSSGAMRYDGTGNLVSTAGGSGGGGSALIWDAHGRLIEVAGPAGRVRYSYDALGRCQRRVVEPSGSGAEPTTEEYSYAGWSLIEKRDGNGAVAATYVHGAVLDEVVSMRVAGCDYYLHGDDQQSVVLVTDSAGHPVSRVDYTDFGAPVFLDTDGRVVADAAPAPVPFLFTGRIYDPATGYYDYRTRWLDPHTGRFLSRDTIGDWGDAANLGNGYTYLGGNPWLGRDPWGLDAIWNWQLWRAANPFGCCRFDGSTWAGVSQTVGGLVGRIQTTNATATAYLNASAKTAVQGTVAVARTNPAVNAAATIPEVYEDLRNGHPVIATVRTTLAAIPLTGALKGLAAESAELEGIPKDVEEAATMAPATSSEVRAQGTLIRNQYKLIKNLGGIPKNYAGHHLIAVSVAQKFTVMDKAAELGYDINRATNGIALPTTIAESLEKGMPVHIGKHLAPYFDIVTDELTPLQNRFANGNLSDEALLGEIANIEARLRSLLETGAVRLHNAGWP